MVLTLNEERLNLMGTKMTCNCDRCGSEFLGKNESKQVSFPSMGENYKLCSKCWLGLMHFMLNEPKAPSGVPIENP